MSKSFDNLEHLKQKCLTSQEIVSLSDNAKQVVKRYIDDLYDQVFLKNPRVFTKYSYLTDEDIEYLLDKLDAQTEMIKILQEELREKNGTT